ncbi:glycosyltransferase family 2 protein [Acidithiobacillus thiooxidans]|uniref:Putative glycosyltransferase EpsH n=1 Tax=Acidithiobacillus thiooxidans ATCC 19377 TaxID=637390 RepID=A0A543Q4F5_ACITH|nr:glycosyltransferase family 2 protein [Acidithiobacillus thiooxidans]MDX5934684.1 glycosyltransferase family 2 protein [Acidithiobacillus thiooxidans]TQN51193.1 putative glycosyltransferase EpsH [Acidithiobacillus thiooxidans ATCC 19377]
MNREETQSEKIPLVSIVVMAYQRVDYLKVTMNSILSQTMKDFELIIADDSDSAKIRELCENYNDPRIQYKPNKINLGMIQNAKNGMRMARGKYIANIHDDDFVDQYFIEKMIQPMEQDENIGLVFCDHKIVNAEGYEDPVETEKNTRKWRRENLNEGFIDDKFGAFINGVIPIPSARLFRRNSIDIDEIYEETSLFYDWWMSFLHAKSTYKIYYVNERLTYYRVHENSTTSASDIRATSANLYIYNYLEKNNYINKKEPVYKKNITHSSIRLANNFLMSKKKNEAIEILIKNLKPINKALFITMYCISILPSPLSVYLLKKAKRLKQTKIN